MGGYNSCLKDYIDEENCILDKPELRSGARPIFPGDNFEWSKRMRKGFLLIASNG